MRFLIGLVLAIGMMVGSPLPIFADTYKLDAAHTNVGFKIKHLVISTVNGRFNKFEGSFDFNEKKGTIDSVEAKIDAASIDTNEPDRDKHLRSKDFFNVEKYPHLTFKSTSVKKKGKKLEVKGKLTIHGKTKEVTLKGDVQGPVTDPWGNGRLAFNAETEINRKDFGLTWNKTLDKGGLMIGNTVWIILEGEAIKQEKESDKKK